MQDIRDVKPPAGLPWYVWLLVLLALCAVAAVIYFYRRRKKPVPPPAPVPVRRPWDIAHESLEELARKDYPRQGLFKDFYITLSDIVRRYLEDRFDIHAPEMTTEEFLGFAETSGALKTEHQHVLKNFLNGCDMVKFAKHKPTVQEAQSNFDMARQLIEETRDGV